MFSLRTVAVAALFSLSSMAYADFDQVPSGQYQLDTTHGYLSFSYNHLGLSNPMLSFDDFNVDLMLDKDNISQSTVNVVIDMDSVVAGSPVWHDHITDSDFFDTNQHAQATFQSTAISAAGNGQYTVQGDLTIKGVTKSVTLQAKINAAMPHPMNKKPVIGLSATGTILRSDFGLGKYVPYVSDEVAITVNVEMTQS